MGSVNPGPVSFVILRMRTAIDSQSRFVNLGNPTRVLATEEPQAQDILPIDDEAWDNDVRCWKLAGHSARYLT